MHRDGFLYLFFLLHAVIHNGQGNRIYNSKFNDGKDAYHKIGFNYANSKKIFKNKSLVIDMAKSLSESDFVLRELAAEEVRKEKNRSFELWLKENAEA